MIFIWGKQTYGAVSKVGNVAVKTMFGHLWYLPLFPMGSYYFVNGSKDAFELKQINWRSAFSGYVRVWGPIFALFTLLGFQGSQQIAGKVLAGMLMTAALAAVIASYVLDKKYSDKNVDAIRGLMERHFGVAVDPYECASSLEMAINDKMQSLTGAPLEQYWYKRTLNDPFSASAPMDLALLRARCDQHDPALQELALQKLQRRATPL